MKHHLKYRFITMYLLYGILGFILVATLISSCMTRRFRAQEANRLYKEALSISSGYASDYYDNRLTYHNFEKELSVVANYLDTSIWIISPKGSVWLDTSPLEADQHVTSIPEFNVTDFGSNYYAVGDFAAGSVDFVFL